MPCQFLGLAALLVCLICNDSAHLSSAQEAVSPSHQISPTADSRFRTPQHTAARWVKAVNGCHWGEEYQCYTGDQQAKFTLQVIISTDELRDSQDLFSELHRIFDIYRFPMRVLDEFPTLRSDLSHLREEADIQKAIDQQLERRQMQVVRWKQHIQPLAIDWAGLIDDLQPLLTQSYNRHLHDLHISSTGIAHHLNYHRFIRESINEIDGTIAHGIVVPVIRDAKLMLDDKLSMPEPRGLLSILSIVKRDLGIGSNRNRNGERSPEKIRLVKVDEGWKLDSVPFR